MTHAALSRDEKPGLQLSELVLLPFALMLALFRCFFGDKLQWARRQRRTRAMPKNWRRHYDELRLAEWSVVELTRAGLAQLLSGQKLDLEGIETSDPPEDWVFPMPASAFAMHRRIEAVLAFNADPEDRIRRLARRAAAAGVIAAAAPTAAPGTASAPSAQSLGNGHLLAPPLLRAVITATAAAAVVAAPAIPPRIRAPPIPGDSLEVHWKRRSFASKLPTNLSNRASPLEVLPIGLHSRPQPADPDRRDRGRLPHSIIAHPS